MAIYDDNFFKSMDLIWKYSDDANTFGDGYFVGFSGGKDSQVMLDLFRRSGVKYHAHYSVTTNDMPENVYFIRNEYPDVEFIHPKLNFFQLIEKKKSLPTALKRYCCAYLKEQSGKGFVALGCRREESAKRAKYTTLLFEKNRDTYDRDKMSKDKRVRFYPILEWTEREIWQYIENNGIPVNPCYESSGRVGCMFCPFAPKRNLIYNAKRYPRYHALLMRSIQRLIDNGYMREFAPVTAGQVWEWWISKENAKSFFTQLELFDDEKY